MAEPYPPRENKAQAPSATGLMALGLSDFRNYETLRLSFDRSFVVFAGENGAGKTNLLEAISLLTPGRGLRRAAYGDIARQGGSGGFAVRAQLSGEAGETQLATVARPDGEGGITRVARIDETQARSADELLQFLRVVWLTPAMDGLFTGPASDRRRFLDRMVLAVDPAHGRRAADYERAMRSRNRLLTENHMDDSWLSGLEAQIAELGVAMAVARAHLVAMMRAMIDATGAETPFPQADLTLTGGYVTDDFERAAGDLEDEVLERLRRSRYADRASGRTGEGPHRAELSVTHRAKAMPAALSSTGEQKALLIGLVLAHARLVAAVSSLSPILLLDEIAAHLDPGRRAALFDLIDGMNVQTFMTGTDASLFDALGERAQMFDVRNGAVS